MNTQRPQRRQVGLRGSRVAPRLGVSLARWRCSPTGKAVPFSRFCLLRGETQESVDDLLVGTVSERYGFIQAKRKACFSDRLNGDFVSVLDQAVRQIAAQANDGIAGPGVATRTINRSSPACHQLAVWRQHPVMR